VVILQDVSLSIPRGSLVAVCGSTGSGKSTLVAGILGECQVMEGDISVVGNVSYVSQSAWIQNASLRANILFGSEYEDSRYKAVIAACGLEVDLKQLVDGDMTDIGEKGESVNICVCGIISHRINLQRVIPRSRKF
jgi:ABC-type multidrug transport system fused ATPase/permease subunit